MDRGNISVFNGSSHAIEAGRKSVSAMAAFRPGEVPVYLWFCMDVRSMLYPSRSIPPTDPLHQVKARITRN
jgi:hypothetical protein